MWPLNPHLPHLFLVSFLFLFPLTSPSPPAPLPTSPDPFPPLLTTRGFIGNSIGPGLTDPTYGQVLSSPNNYAAVTLDLNGDLYTNTIWEESAKEMNRIDGRGVWRGRVEEAHGWSRTGGLAVAVGSELAFFGAVQGYIGPGYDPPQYPSTGQSWWGLFVINKTSMMPVSIPGGTSFEHMLLVTSETGMATAVALDSTSQMLTVVHPTDGALTVWDTKAMKVTSTVRGTANWTSLTFLSSPQSLWGVLAGQVYRVDPKTGQPMGSAIPGIEQAMSVMASHATSGVLVVADGGLHTQQVLLLNVATTPMLVGTIGEKGGVWGPHASDQPPRGYRGPLRFEWLTGAGQRADGSVVVVMASSSVFKGSEMMGIVRSFQSAGEGWDLQWEMEGNGWVDAGSFDPESGGRHLYVPNCVYEVTLPFHPTRPSGRCIASTTDLVGYPEDPRLHQDNFSWQCARVVWLDGKKFLMLTGMYGGAVALFRYAANDTFTAIPAVLIMVKGPYTDQHKGEVWPPFQPNSAYTWTDANCNGRFEAGEYTSNTILVDAWSTSIDAAGSLWIVHEHGVERTGYMGLDGCGNPRYNRGVGSTNWTIPSEFSFLERVHYEVGLDRLMLTGWDPHNPEGHGARWGTAGNLLTLYDGWLTSNRTVFATTPLHSEWNATLYPMGPVIKTVSWAPPFIFLVEGYSATVTVMDDTTLRNLTSVLYNPGPNPPAWHNGWIDVPDGLQATRVNSSLYLVAMEDDYCAKTALLAVSILPDNVTLCARLAKSLIGNNTGQGEVALMALLMTTVWLGTPDTRHGANVFGLANPLSPLIPLLRGDIPYRGVGSPPPNYLNDTEAQAALAMKFVGFIGGAMGCRGEGFPVYVGVKSQWEVHRGMGIRQAEFDYFNAQVTLSLQYWGVEVGSRDMEGVREFLESFGKGTGENEICTAEDCAEKEEGVYVSEPRVESD